MPRVFISYRHSDGEWVWNRLTPCLEAGGAEVLIDRERFQAGIAVVGQMDAAQDRADVHVLVITRGDVTSFGALGEGCQKPSVFSLLMDDANWHNQLMLQYLSKTKSLGR